MEVEQGWKLQTVPLSGTGKIRGGQVKILDNIPKEMLKFCNLLIVCLSGTGKNSAGQVDLSDTFPKGKAELFCNFHPCQRQIALNWKGKHSMSQHWLDPDVLLSSPQLSQAPELTSPPHLSGLGVFAAHCRGPEHKGDTFLISWYSGQLRAFFYRVGGSV